MTVQSRRWSRRSGAEGDMSLQRLGRSLDPCEHLPHEVVRRDVVRQRLEREDDAMAEHVEREVLHVLSRDVATAAEERERARGEDEVDRRSWARAVADVLGHLGKSVIAWLARRRC